MPFLPINAIAIGAMRRGVSKPAAPQNLAASTIDEVSIGLTWDAVTGADSYKIYYGTDGVTFGSSTTSATNSKTVEGLIGNTLYYFYVVAVKGSGESDPSNIDYAVAITTFLDTFSTDLAAGNVNGTLSDSGHLRTIVDTENKLSIASGNLVVYKRAVNTWSDPKLDYSIFPICNGGALEFNITPVGSGRFQVGYGIASQSYNNTTFDFQNNYQTSFWGNLPLATNVEYSCRIITGFGYTLLLIKGGTQYLKWTVLTCAFGLIEQQRLIRIINYSGNPYRISVIKATQYQYDYWGINYYKVSSSPWTLTMPNYKGIVVFKWRVITDEVVIIKFRKSDENNYWYVKYDAAAQAQKVSMGKVVDGTLTEVVALGASTLVNNQSWTSVIATTKEGSVAYANTIYIESALKTKDTFNETATGIEVVGCSEGYELIYYPLEYEDTDFITVKPKRIFNIWCYGDSKTAGSGLTPSYSNWTTLLSILTNTIIKPATLAASGLNTLVAAGRIDADLAATVGIPDYVCWQVGVNDIGVMTETQYKTSLAYCLDAIHAKFPNAKIFISDSWQRGADAASDTMALYRDEVIATRPWCYTGPDERIYLKSDDDGHEYTVDGVHPNGWGYIAMAKAWEASLGL